METLVSENVATPRFRTLLFATFAGLAICLAIAGVYGVMAYTVGQRTNDMGLRMALGASSRSVALLVLKQGVFLVALGSVLGLAASVISTRLLTAMLFQVKPNDPLVYSGVAVLLGLVSLVASYFPARRASRIDPLSALRQE